MEASTKSFEMKEPSANNLPTQIKDVIVNPQNPENPDSKPGVGGKFILKPIGEKTRGIASLHGIQKPDEMDSPKFVCHCAVNRGMHLYHGRTNAIRPYNLV
jgi:hypothetical protein